MGDFILVMRHIFDNHPVAMIFGHRQKMAG
jgi:hypothetical protein